jgi:hypothetical protein
MRATIATLGAAALVIAASGCAGSGAGPTTTTTTTTKPQPSRESRRVEPIALARASNALFSIFPAKPGKKKCGIPEGGIHFEPMRGTCTTSVEITHGRDITHGREPVLAVTFTERWRFRCPRTDDCVAAPVLHHSWQVIERRRRVVATRMSGSVAPQYYK